MSVTFSKMWSIPGNDGKLASKPIQENGHVFDVCHISISFGMFFLLKNQKRSSSFVSKNALTSPPMYPSVIYKSTNNTKIIIVLSEWHLCIVVAWEWWE